MQVDSVGVPVIDLSGLTAAGRVKATGDNPLAALTADDRALIKSVTGFIVSPDGVVTNGPEINGDLRPVDPFIVNLAGDRLFGNLKGDVTAKYLTDLFAKYAKDPTAPLNQGYLQKSLEYLERKGRQDRIDLSL